MKGLILIYLITAIATVGSLRHPRLGLYVYVGFAVLRPQEIFGWAGDMSSLSNYVAISMLVGWVFAGFGSWQFGRARGVVLMLVGFVTWFALSGLFGINPDNSFKSLQEFLKVVLPVFVGATLLTEPSHWKTLLWVIVLSQGYVGFEMNNDYYFKNYNTANFGFGPGDNNFFGLILVTTLGPAVALAIISRKWYQKGIAAVASLLILHTILLTFSRGAMVGLLAVGATAFVMLPKRPKYLLPLGLTIALAVSLTGPELMARYRTTFASAEERDGSAESRLDLWRDCLIVIRDYPVFGVGPANWRLIVDRYGWPTGKSAHSVWMETAAETGIPGAMLLFLFFGVTAAKLWPVARARYAGISPDEQALATGGVLAVVGFAVTGQFVSAAGMEVPYYVTTAAIGMLRTARFERKRASTHEAPPEHVFRPRVWQPAPRPGSATSQRSWNVRPAR